MPKLRMRNTEAESQVLYLDEEWPMSHQDLWRTGLSYSVCCIVLPLLVGLGLHRLLTG